MNQEPNNKNRNAFYKKIYDNFSTVLIENPIDDKDHFKVISINCKLIKDFSIMVRVKRNIKNYILFYDTIIINVSYYASNIMNTMNKLIKSMDLKYLQKSKYVKDKKINTKNSAKLNFFIFSEDDPFKISLISNNDFDDKLTRLSYNVLKNNSIIKENFFSLEMLKSLIAVKSLESIVFIENIYYDENNKTFRIFDYVMNSKPKNTDSNFYYFLDSFDNSNEFSLFLINGFKDHYENSLKFIDNLSNNIEDYSKNIENRIKYYSKNINGNDEVSILKNKIEILEKDLEAKSELLSKNKESNTAISSINNDLQELQSNLINKNEILEKKFKECEKNKNNNIIEDKNLKSFSEKFSKYIDDKNSINIDTENFIINLIKSRDEYEVSIENNKNIKKSIEKEIINIKEFLRDDEDAKIKEYYNGILTSHKTNLENYKKLIDTDNIIFKELNLKLSSLKSSSNIGINKNVLHKKVLLENKKKIHEEELKRLNNLISENNNVFFKSGFNNQISELIKKSKKSIEEIEVNILYFDEVNNKNSKKFIENKKNKIYRTLLDGLFIQVYDLDVLRKTLSDIYLEAMEVKILEKQYIKYDSNNWFNAYIVELFINVNYKKDIDKAHQYLLALLILYFIPKNDLNTDEKLMKNKNDIIKSFTDNSLYSIFDEYGFFSYDFIYLLITKFRPGSFNWSVFPWDDTKLSELYTDTKDSNKIYDSYYRLRLSKLYDLFDKKSISTRKEKLRIVVQRENKINNNTNNYHNFIDLFLILTNYDIISIFKYESVNYDSDFLDDKGISMFFKILKEKNEIQSVNESIIVNGLT